MYVLIVFKWFFKLLLILIGLICLLDKLLGNRGFRKWNIGYWNIENWNKFDNY